MKILEISSSANAYFRKVQSLNSAKGIKSEGLMLISGRKLIHEVLSHAKLREDFQEILFDGKLEDEARELANQFGLGRGTKFSNELFKEIDEVGTRAPLLVLRAPKIPPFEKSLTGLNVFLALSDPANLGAALRSLEAFEADQIVLLKECANAHLPKVTKTSSGSNLRVPLVSGPHLKDLSLTAGVGLDASGKDIALYTWPDTTNLVLGEEGQGLPENLRTRLDLVSIPMSPQVESLNATVALSIACYSHSQRSRREK